MKRIVHHRGFWLALNFAIWAGIGLALAGCSDNAPSCKAGSIEAMQTNCRVQK